jgi:LysM repeat protein
MSTEDPWRDRPRAAYDRRAGEGAPGPTPGEPTGALPADAEPPRAEPVPAEPLERLGGRHRRGSWLPWLTGAAIVIGLAVAGGLLTAWLVANFRAVPPPAAGDGSPRPTAGATPGPTATEAPPTAVVTERPRFTPSPAPVVTAGPEPFVHVVERGESLTRIAEFYSVDVDDIIALNDIRNPNRIRVGQELLIPGYGIRPSPEPG